MEITDVIKKIIWDEPNVQTSAREIAEMMSEFIEWTSSEYFDGTRWWIKEQEGMTTDELFTYWKENIKNNNHGRRNRKNINEQLHKR